VRSQAAAGNFLVGMENLFAKRCEEHDVPCAGRIDPKAVTASLAALRLTFS
jgi:hypothetical protein